MDADILRLFLFLSGVALILGIYFWDRHKKINARINAIHKAERRRREQESGAEIPEQRQEPVWDGKTAEASETVEPDDLSESLKELGEIIEEEGADKRDPFSAEQSDLEFSRKSNSSSVDKRDVPIPRKILQINIMAKRNPINGDALMRAARDSQLEPGEMQIFHQYNEEMKHKEPIFSMASVVEPGTFPFDAMGEFSTPGLTLFAQLPGPLDGMETFDRMLATAHRLGAMLDAELLDETRSGLSRQTIEHIREEISEHGRLVRLARRR